MDAFSTIEPKMDPKSQLSSLDSEFNSNNKKLSLYGTDYLIHKSSEILFEVVYLLNKKGYLIIQDTQLYSGNIPGHCIDQVSETLLNSLGFYVNAVIQEEPNYEMRGQRNFSTFVVISKNKMNDFKFVANLTDSTIDLASNFFAGIETQDEEINLNHGYFIKQEDFYTLEQLRNTTKAQSTIFFNYDGYKQVLFKDLVGVNEEDDEDTFDFLTETMGDITDDPEHDDARLLAFLRKIPLQDKLDSKLLAICLDHSSDIIKVSESSDEYEYLYFYVDNRENARYLEIFFNSELGRQIYHSNLKFKDSNKTLSTDQIYNLKILIPEKKELLEDTIEAYEKLNELSRSVNKLKKSFLENPKETISNDINVLDDMLLAAGSLNEIDEIYALIRREEGSDTEFKETFRLPVGDDVKPEQFTPLSKQISAGVIKVINSFINTNGGDLLIGVRDSDHEITGLQNELDHFFSSKERTILEKQDQFKKHFNSILTNSFKENFVNENIEYKFVDMGDRFVLRVTCSRSKKPCVIKVKSKLNSYLGGDFFFRTGSESKPLHGQEQFDYVHEHFYGNK